MSYLEDRFLPAHLKRSGPAGAAGAAGVAGPSNLLIQAALPDTDLSTYLWVDTSVNPPTLWVTI